MEINTLFLFLTSLNLNRMSTADPPLHLKTNLPCELEQAQLERYVTVGGDNVRRRCRVPVMTK